MVEALLQWNRIETFTPSFRNRMLKTVYFVPQETISAQKLSCTGENVQASKNKKNKSIIKKDCMKAIEQHN